MKLILQNANIVNEGKISKNDLLINGDIIEKISDKIIKGITINNKIEAIYDKQILNEKIWKNI